MLLCGTLYPLAAIPAAPRPSAQYVRGDVNGDGVADVEDLNIVINIMLSKAAYFASADLTGDGVVDVDELNIVLNSILNKNKPSDTEMCMVLEHKDGTLLLFGLSRAPRITYQNGKVLIHGTTMLECDFSAIKKIMFQPMVRSAEGGMVQMPRNRTTLVLLSNDGGLEVELFADDGTILHRYVASSGAPAVIPIDDSTATSRILKVNGITYRISKQ